MSTATTSRVIRARYCIQCEDVEGRVGDFVYREGLGGRHPISPIFASLQDLFIWMDRNGWRRTGSPLDSFECTKVIP